MMTGVAVVGAGHWGPHLIRNFNDNLASQALWVVERDEARRKAIATRFPSVSVTESIDEVLDDDRVDAVVVATPTSTHFALVEQSLSAGKHVLVEKPITDNLAKAEELVSTAANRSLVLMVGHVFLFNPAIIAARTFIESEQLGPIRYISMVRTNLGPVRRDVNAAWDLASHDVSISNYWLGSNPISASATGGSWLNSGVQDVAFITLHYPFDVLVHIEASWLNPRKRRLISVVGGDKMLTVDDMDLNEPLRIYNKGIDASDPGEFTDSFAGFRSQIREGEVLIPHVTGGEPLRTECDEFLNRIKGGTDTRSDGQAGADVVAVLEAIEKSMSNSGTATPVEVAS